MNISHTMPKLSKPSGNDPVPPPTLQYMRTRNRMRFFTLIHKELEQNGITRAQLAQRMGRGLDRISHLLAAPANLTLDTISDVLFSISGAELKHEVSHPLDRPARNYTRPEWLSESQKYRWVEESQTQTQKTALRRFESQGIETKGWEILKVKDEDNKHASKSEHSASNSGLLPTG